MWLIAGVNASEYKFDLISCDSYFCTIKPLFVTFRWFSIQKFIDIESHWNRKENFAKKKKNWFFLFFLMLHALVRNEEPHEQTWQKDFMW